MYEEAASPGVIFRKKRDLNQRNNDIFSFNIMPMLNNSQRSKELKSDQKDHEVVVPRASYKEFGPEVTAIRKFRKDMDTLIEDNK